MRAARRRFPEGLSMTRTLLSNVRIFDGLNDTLSGPASLLIEHDRIVSIVPLGEAANADVTLDLEGRTVMPGLIDAHFHAYASRADLVALEKMPPTYVAQTGRAVMEGAL